MTELISVSTILKHLSYKELEVTHFAEHSKGVFTLQYNLPYNGPKVNDIIYRNTSYELEIGSLGLSFIQHENSRNPIRSNKGYYRIPGWSTTFTWNSVKDENPDDQGESGIHKKIQAKIKDLGYAWANDKIGSL